MRRSLRVSMFNELLRVSTNSHAPSLQVLVNGSRCEHMRVSASGPCALCFFAVRGFHPCCSVKSSDFTTKGSMRLQGKQARGSLKTAGRPALRFAPRKSASHKSPGLFTL